MGGSYWPKPAVEADLAVAADGVGVGGGRVDDQAVVAALGDQPAGQGADGVGAQALPLPPGRQEEVDAGVAELRVGLLAELDRADHLALHDDGEHARVPLRWGPPQRHLRLPDDPVERGGVGGGGGAGQDPLAAQLQVAHRVPVPRATQPAKWSSTRPQACMRA